jgi:hypothetical protein
MQESQMLSHRASFNEVLLANAAAPERAGKMDLYSWLVGSWALDVTETHADGSQRRCPGEWHFAWVLEGRAIQDVWLVPSRRAGRPGDAVQKNNYYGTTLRVYDPRIDAWRIQWTDPVAQIYLTLLGRKQDDRIVQEGKSPTGTAVRWSFFDIAANTFRWRSELSNDGATWTTNMEFSAVRD